VYYQAPVRLSPAARFGENQARVIQPETIAGCGPLAWLTAHIQVKPTLTLKSVLDITPGQLGRLGVKGIIFDLDDTLMRLGTGVIQPPVLHQLKRLQSESPPIRMSVVTNNPNPFYYNKATPQFKNAGLSIPVIGNALKPLTGSLQRAANIMKLKPSEIVVVGDHPLLDILAGQRIGMKTILVDSLNPNPGPISRAFRSVEALFLKA
jgi:HAD superfamily phosphatase (TIGR01668 family)